MNEQTSIQNKICSKCNEDKLTSEFSAFSRSNDGFGAWCKSCMKIAAQTHYQNNKDRYVNRAKQWQKDHVNELREYQKKYYSTPKSKEKTKAYQLANKEKISEYAKTWAKNNVEKRRLAKRQWDQKHRLDPFHRVSNNIRTNMAHALQGKKGFRKWESLVGYSLQDLINHLQSKLSTDMTWDNYGSLWQVDHITPKSWFKYDSAEHPEFKKCWALANLQPKLTTDNIKKGNRFIG